MIFVFLKKWFYCCDVVQMKFLVVIFIFSYHNLKLCRWNGSKYSSNLVFVLFLNYNGFLIFKVSAFRKWILPTIFWTYNFSTRKQLEAENAFLANLLCRLVPFASDKLWTEDGDGMDRDEYENLIQLAKGGQVESGSELNPEIHPSESDSNHS
jgi:hypothetical protein